MSPKKEARSLKKGDVIIRNGREHKIKSVMDFGNRIVVMEEEGVDIHYDVSAEVDVK